MSTNQSNEANSSTFTTGIGYLNRIREVKPRGKGKPFMAVTGVAGSARPRWMMPSIPISTATWSALKLKS